MTAIFRLNPKRSITYQECLKRTQRFIVDDEGADADGASKEPSTSELLALISTAAKISREARNLLERRCIR